MKYPLFCNINNQTVMLIGPNRVLFSGASRTVQVDEQPMYPPKGEVICRKVPRSKIVSDFITECNKNTEEFFGVTDGKSINFDCANVDWNLLFALDIRKPLNYPTIAHFAGSSETVIALSPYKLIFGNGDQLTSKTSIESQLSIPQTESDIKADDDLIDTICNISKENWGVFPVRPECVTFDLTDIKQEPEIKFYDEYEIMLSGDWVEAVLEFEIDGVMHFKLKNPVPVPPGAPTPVPCKPSISTGTYYVAVKGDNTNYKHNKVAYVCMSENLAEFVASGPVVAKVEVSL